jgi:hypothetical protein
LRASAESAAAASHPRAACNVLCVLLTNQGAIMTSIDPIEASSSKLREELAKKIATYSHWPDSRKLGDKLLPFTESEGLVFLLADILQNDRWDKHPEFCTKESHGGKYASYGAFVHILIQYVIHRKARCDEVISVLGRATDQAVGTVTRDEFDNRYYMLRCIFNGYKKEKHFPAALSSKLDAVPDDKLRFTPIDGGSAYEVLAYSDFTRGEIKIPPTHNGKPVRKIAYRGFDGSGITGVEIPEGVETIEGFAFAGTRLKSVHMPQSLKSIGEYAFRYCKFSGEVVIPGHVEKMGGHVFESTKPSAIRVEGHTEKPAGWSDDWNKNGGHEFHPVIWGHAA